MGCAPSAATGRSSSRLSNADDAGASGGGVGGGEQAADCDGMPAASRGGASRGSTVGGSNVKPKENGDAQAVKVRIEARYNINVHFQTSDDKNKKDFNSTLLLLPNRRGGDSAESKLCIEIEKIKL